MELQSVLEQTNDHQVTFRIDLSPDNTETLIDQFTIALAYQYGITPDEGQSLDEAVSTRIGKEDLDARLGTSIMGYVLPFAAEASDVQFVGSPAFAAEKPPARGEGFSFSALCTLKPAFELSSYDPVEITVPPLEVTDQEVERSLAALAQSKAYLVEGDHADVQRGDVVELKIETYRDGVRCDQLCSEGRTYTAGSDAMPADFDDRILEMSAGDTRTIEYDVPGFTIDENFEPEVEHYVSTVTVKRIQRMVVPEVTDEWVRENLPEFGGRADLEKETRNSVLARKTYEYRHYKNLQSSIELAKRFVGEIPDLVYEAVIADVARMFDEQLSEQGMTRDDFLRQQGLTEQQVERHFTHQVHEQLARQFALDAVARHFELEVDDGDLDEYFRTVASPGLESMVRLDFERNGKMHEARLSALRLKANDYVTEHAVVHIAES